MIRRLPVPYQVGGGNNPTGPYGFRILNRFTGDRKWLRIWEMLFQFVRTDGVRSHYGANVGVTYASVSTFQ